MKSIFAPIVPLLLCASIPILAEPTKTDKVIPTKAFTTEVITTKEELIKLTPKQPEQPAKPSKNAKIYTDAGMNKLVSLAKQTLISKKNVKEGDIEVLRAQYVSWRDSSLGCPKPGYQYLQMITEGAQVKLKAKGKVYSFHSGPNKPLFYCPKPSSIGPINYEFGDK